MNLLTNICQRCKTNSRFIEIIIHQKKANLFIQKTELREKLYNILNLVCN